MMRHWLWYAVCLSAIAGLTACQPQNSWLPITLAQREPPRPAPLPQDPFIQVYLNHNFAQGADYTEPYRDLTRPGDDLEGVIVDAIAAAQVSIDVAVQEIRLPRVAQALAAKHQAGVRVRVIIENSYNQLWLEKEDSQGDAEKNYQEFLALADADGNGQISPAETVQSDAIAHLRAARVPLIDDTADGSKGSGLMHHKFMVIDGVKVVTGSANWTPSGTHGDLTEPTSRGNVNNLLVIQDATVAQIFTQEFNLMWGDGPGGQPDSQFGLQKPARSPAIVTVGNSTVTINFSPISPSQPWAQSSNGLIGRTLQQAQQQVDLALFVFSEQPIVDILRDRHAQGVQVRVLIDPSFAFRNFSEGLDMLGVTLLQDCKMEENNAPWTNPVTTVGMAALAESDKLHRKMGVVDGRIAITGSHNWSAAANHNNDETVIVIQNPVVAAHFQQEFERLYQDASLGLPPKIETKIEEAAQSCPVTPTP